MKNIDPKHRYTNKEARELMSLPSSKSLKYRVQKGYFKEKHISVLGTPKKKRYLVSGQGILDYIKKMNG